MEDVVISGIQQIGVGVKNVHEAWKWYHKYFGFDCKIFEEAAPAEFMLPYTGGQPKQRHAILAINLQGGGGFEIWQYTDRTPEAPKFDIQLGDLGINTGIIKCKNVDEAYAWFKSEQQEILSEPIEIEGRKQFFVRDPFGNIFMLAESDEWFRDEGKLTGGSYGVIVGVSDVKKARIFYNAVLGYDHVVYDKIDYFPDLKGLPGGDKKFRRVVLSHSKAREGSFAPILGSSTIELIEAIDYKPRKIFEDRYWGDLGFIHLCYDIKGMDVLREKVKEMNFPFTVDVGKDFDMGEAAGTFSYNEDPDGTLIEYVETYKVPILKALNISIDLRKRDPKKALPMWLLKAMRFNKVKKIK